LKLTEQNIYRLMALVLIGSVAAGATIYIFSLPPSTERGQLYLYLQGQPLQSAESLAGNPAAGYIVLNPGESRSFALTLHVYKVNAAGSLVPASFSSPLSLSFDAPAWLNVSANPSELGASEALNLSVTASSYAPLGNYTLVKVESNDSSLNPVTFNVVVVASTELVIPQDPRLYGNATNGLTLSAGFIIAHDSPVTSIEMKLPQLNITVTSLAPPGFFVSNDSGIWVGASARSEGTGGTSFPLPASPQFYTFDSGTTLPSSLFSNGTEYNLTIFFNFTDGLTYSYTQQVEPAYVSGGNTTGAGAGPVSFVLILDDTGYNDSRDHGAPQQPWPVITVHQGQQVTITLINKDANEAHGFTINRYFDQGVVLQPGQTYTLTFTANSAGNFIFYCNILCTVHIYMVGELVVVPG
jgi:hypothetical protein